jgi:hypothetical protein
VDPDRSEQPFAGLIVARASSPSYPDRLVALFFEGDRYDVAVCPSSEERDALLAKLTEDGAQLMDVRCGQPGCACATSLMLDDDGRPAEDGASGSRCASAPLRAVRRGARRRRERTLLH